MKISIPERINLQDIIMSSQWNETYLLVKSCGVSDIKEFNRGKNQIIRKSETLEREKAKYNKIYESGTAEDEDKLLQHIEQLGDEAQEQEEKLFDFFVDFVAKRFISGRVFDSETESLVDVTNKNITEVLNSLNLKVLQKVIGVMLGNDSKKG